MGRFLVVLSLSLVFAGRLAGQPMSGSYTIGGSLPDFVTLQDAANAVKSRGVSGPVFLNIRPGTYTRDGGASPVLVLDSVIAGVSPASRITLQPDGAAGGNVGNVILQADFNSSVNPALYTVADVGADYVTIRGLTFRDADSVDVPATCLLQVSYSPWNARVEGLVVEGCRFLGSPHVTSGVQYGTGYGIGAGAFLMSATITDNSFSRLLGGVWVDENGEGDSIVVEDNTFRDGYMRYSGSGNRLGGPIQVTCLHASVRRNDIATSGSGNIGIGVFQPRTAVIERNSVVGPFSMAIMSYAGSSFQWPSDSILIVNNIVRGGHSFASLWITTENTKLLHNTIENLGGGFGDVGLYFVGAHGTVVNNIILFYGSTIGIEYGLGGDAVGLVSDHNVLFSLGTYFARRNGNYYFSFATYQTGSGLDSNSVSKDVAFTSDSLGIHLDECEAQDRTLDGTPLPEVPADYYGARRDTLRPFVGAVEGVHLPYDMFGDVFKTGLRGFPFSLAAGNFDTQPGVDIAVPDYDNRQIRMFYKSPGSRSFVNSGTLFTIVKPVFITTSDLDLDGHPDLVVGGDTTAIEVWWGSASGFTDRTIIGTYGRVSALQPGPDYAPGQPTMLVTADNGFLPNVSSMDYLVGSTSRNLCYETIRTGSDLHQDTVFTVMDHFVYADVGGDTTKEVMALALDSPSHLVLFKDLQKVTTTFPLCGPFLLTGVHDVLTLGIGDYTNGSIVVGDFDGDGDNDLITTGASEDTVVLLRNGGNFNFAPEKIGDHGMRGIVVLDYDNDGDLDFVTCNRNLEQFGVTVFLNDGTGHFTKKRNCFYPFASGQPRGMVAADFDLDGKTDIAVTTVDSLFVLYNLGGLNATTGVREPAATETPEGFAISQNYPNPFNPSTRIEYVLPAQSHVAITIYNILGQEVASLLDEDQMGGRHSVEWNGRSTRGVPVSSGVYFYRIEAKRTGGWPLFAEVKKMLLVK
jgi:hypothetical protein